MQLDIITPEKVVFSGRVSQVILPGAKGRFTVLKNHAPILSGLEQGEIVYRVDGEDFSIQTGSGFVEVNNNKISIAVELPYE